MVREKVFVHNNAQIMEVQDLFCILFMILTVFG